MIAFFNSVFKFITSIPNRAGGNWLAARSRPAYFVYRQAWHFIGGATVASFAALFGIHDPIARTVFISAFGGVLAFSILWIEQDDQRDGQSAIKTFVDPTFWFMGFALVMVVTS